MTSGVSPAATPDRVVSFVGVPSAIDRSARLPPYPNEAYDAIVVRMRALFKECTDARTQEKESAHRGREATQCRDAGNPGTVRPTA